MISELDLNNRKVFISKTHFILNFSAEEIRFEDIESIEVQNIEMGELLADHVIKSITDEVLELHKDKYCEC